VAERVQRLRDDLPGGRDALLVELTNWVWPPEIKVAWFQAFIAADASDARDETIRSLATTMLQRRCGKMTAWGPACERVHFQFDWAYLEWPAHRRERRWGRWRTTFSDEIPELSTTSHEDQSLARALWYATYNWPSGEGFYDRYGPATLVALVEPIFREEVSALLLDLERLERESDDEA